MRRQVDSERGSALVFVLWLSVLLSAVLLAVTSLTHTRLRLIAAERDEVLRQTALRSALDVVAYDIAQIGRSHLAALPVQVQVGAHPVEVLAGPGQTLLDVNMANEADFRALFVRLGESDVMAQTLADQILDWRDADDRPRSRGAEADAYGSRPDDKPANRPFRSIQELRHVLTITPSRLACVAPYLTVLGGTPPPSRDSARFGPDSRIDGMRVSLRARLLDTAGRQHDLVGLAQFETAPDVPFQWVAFGEDGLHNLTCTRGETE
jgi:Type II secretion system (T2SS), protein K